MKKYTLYDLDSKVEKIIESNCVEIPYEGTDVHKYDMKNAIIELIQEIVSEYKKVTDDDWED